jgi:hypothetical protein
MPFESVELSMIMFQSAIGKSIRGCIPWVIAMQDLKEAVKELCRLVLDLKLPGPMLP